TAAVTLPPEAAVTLGTYLLRGCSAEVSGAAGGTVDVHPCGGEGSAAIVFPAASIARASGEIVAGPVRVELAALDPTDAFQRAAIPVSDTMGDIAGAVEVRLHDAASGERLRLAAGASATVRIQVGREGDAFDPGPFRLASFD